ncbi:hypothetical protein SSX86_020975 [Deinandra increscens subsp. villosa]|uniref:SAM domain-containing protein n=1 Tax=Deinandra increscens subsp. villosa TaxID=3103831 RepID=A0AAP0GSP8_9ASTR
MAETSRRSQVTITLGRSGQVVKGAGAVFDGSESVPAVGSKRSVRDRLGDGGVDKLQFDSKRLRGDSGRWNLKTSNFLDDLHLSKDDLRFQIMNRTKSNSKQDMVDLRDILSRPARPSATNPVTPYSLHETIHGRQRVPEAKDSPRHVPERVCERQSMPDPRDDRPRGPVSRDDRSYASVSMDDRPRGPVSRDDRPHGSVFRDDRPRGPVSRDDRSRRSVSRDDRPYGSVSRDDRPRGPVSRDDRPRGLVSRDDRHRRPEPMDGRQCMPEPHDVRNWGPKLDDVKPRMTGQYTSLGTSEGPPRMGFSGNSYSPWTLDHIRRKSPDRGLNTSRGLSPQRRRAYEDSRPVAYGSRNDSENSRPVAPSSFLTKQPLPVRPTKSVRPMPLGAPTPPPGGNMQRSQYPVENLTVEGFLRSLGLEKYLILLKVEEVDMAALSQMGDQDLKELGIPMGPRKKILLARTRRQAR